MISVPLDIGTDHRFDFVIYTSTAETVVRDITGWALSWMVKRAVSDLDAAAILTKTTVSGITITGIFHATPSVNTQLARVTLTDDDTLVLPPNLYVSELKRTDPGFETVLRRHYLELDYAVHRA